MGMPDESDYDVRDCADLKKERTGEERRGEPLRRVICHTALYILQGLDVAAMLNETETKAEGDTNRGASRRDRSDPKISVNGKRESRSIKLMRMQAEQKTLKGLYCQRQGRRRAMRRVNMAVTVTAGERPTRRTGKPKKEADTDMLT